jgi:hypothetical protein
MIGRNAYVAATLLVAAASSPGVAGPGTATAMEHPLSLGVEFTGCVESIGVGLVPTAQAQALVPPAFHVVGEGQPVTPLVVRTADCGGIAVEGRRPRAGSIVQIGLVIVPPDFSGDINNYTLWYYTSDARLAHALERLGVEAQHVPTLDYAFDPGPAGTPVPLDVTVPRPGRPPLEVGGTVTASDAPAGSFLANWWVQGDDGVVKMATTVPVIFIGTADLTLTTRAKGPLGELIGGDTAGFPILQQFNTFGAAGMDVSVTP